MSDADKITAIINAIQTDTTLLVLLRLLITNNIGNAPSPQLEAVMQALQLPES